ncbi:hypothetical protein ACJX0J_025781, partial [Zea mays]
KIKKDKNTQKPFPKEKGQQISKYLIALKACFTLYQPIFHIFLTTWDIGKSGGLIFIWISGSKHGLYAENLTKGTPDPLDIIEQTLQHNCLSLNCQI